MRGRTSTRPRCWDSTPTSSGTRSTRTMTRPSVSGPKKWACRATASCAWARRTTSGRPARPGRADRVRSSTTTKAPSLAAVHRTAHRAATATAISSTGTSCSCSTTGTRTARSSTCPSRTSTRAWVSSGSPPSCRVSTPTSRQTSCGPSWPRPRRSRAPRTARPNAPTAAYGSSQTTRARWPSSSPTGCSPPTRAAATCSGVCCAARCGTDVCSA